MLNTEGVTVVVEGSDGGDASHQSPGGGIGGVEVEL